MSGTKHALLAAVLLLGASSVIAQAWTDHVTSDSTSVVMRHETGSVTNENKLYVLGGRGDRPVQVFDASQNSWSTLAPLPLELHHFQPVVLNNYLYVIGAFTCCFPNEPTIADVYRLNLKTNIWETHGSIPNERLRGSAGTVAYNNKIYIIGGNTNGHSGGAVAWLDEYDPSTGIWQTLTDAPNERDHFSAAVVGNKLIVASGRKTNGGFGGMVAGTDVFDFNTNTWTSVAPIPTPRAGTMLGVRNGNVIIMGGETDTQVQSHDEVEAYHVATNKWRNLPNLNEGRHSGAGGVIGDTLHAITGNLFRGGGQEVTTHETLLLADADDNGFFDSENNENNENNENTDSDNDGLTDLLESQLQTDPLNSDTDTDSISDGDEILIYGTNPLQIDSDSDNLSDSDELQVYFTDPLANDSDKDGLSDGEEILIHNSDPGSPDSDGDGIPDSIEANNGSSLTNIDEDGDGILNSAEGNIDSDGDSIPNFIDLDSDNDGIPDIVENGRTDEDNNGQLDNTDENPPGGFLFDVDQDGIVNLLDLDSDQDGLSDLLEGGQIDNTATNTLTETDFLDSNSNGWHDNLEGSSVRDTDADAIPDFLDLDSDDDGVTDLAASGIIDTNNDGIIDKFIDNNDDGLHDDIAGLIRKTNQPTSGGGSELWIPLLIPLISVALASRRHLKNLAVISR